MPPVGGDLNFYEYDYDYNLVVKITLILTPDLTIQINRHLKNHDEMSFFHHDFCNF